MIKTTNNRLLIKLTSIRKCDGWLICWSVWQDFRAVLSQKHLIETSEPHEYAHFKITYSLGWLMVNNDQVRLAEWLKEQLSSFEWLLERAAEPVARGSLKREENKNIRICFTSICYRRRRTKWSDRQTDSHSITDTNTKAGSQNTAASKFVQVRINALMVCGRKGQQRSFQCYFGGFLRHLCWRFGWWNKIYV